MADLKINFIRVVWIFLCISQLPFLANRCYRHYLKLQYSVQHLRHLDWLVVPRRKVQRKHLNPNKSDRTTFRCKQPRFFRRFTFCNRHAAVEGDRLLVLKHGDVWKRMTVGFKMNSDHWNPRIDAIARVVYFTPTVFDRLSARASRYLYHTVKEAERRGLPTELALLPVIESSPDPAATSSAAGCGLMAVYSKYGPHLWL